MSNAAGILSLPTEILETIFSYLSFEQVSTIRETCQIFNHVSQRVLNQGLCRVERRVQSLLKSMRALLPRRESERREHPMCRRVELLAAVDTRINLLSMTYRRFITAQLCCFIPGKVLDEIWSVLHVLVTAASVKHMTSFQLLQELRDISSMAMEHFDEHIVPSLQKPALTRVLTSSSGGCDRISSVSAPHSSSSPPFPSSTSPHSLLNIFHRRGSMGSVSSSSVATAAAAGSNITAPTPHRNSLVSLLSAAAAVASSSSSHPLSRSCSVLPASGHSEQSLYQTVQQLRQSVGSLTDRLTAQDAIIASLQNRLETLERSPAVSNTPRQGGACTRARASAAGTERAAKRRRT